MHSIFTGILSMVLMLSLNYLYISGSFFLIYTYGIVCSLVFFVSPDCYS